MFVATIMTNISTNLLFCASALLLFRGDVAAEDSGVNDIISDRLFSNHLRARNLDEERITGTGPLNLFQQSTAEEVSQQLRGHDDTPPSPTPPLNLFKQNRIVGGDDVEGGNGAYPFQAQLGSWGFCGGQLIAPDVVLTAAHCVDVKEKDPDIVQIWDGIEMKHREVDSLVPHPDYDSKALFNDLALIKLKEPALAVNEVNDGDGTYWELVDDYEWIDHPPIIRLQRYQTPSGCTSLYSQGLAEDILTLTVIGHGTTSSGGNMSGKLLEADVHYVLNAVCQKQYKNEDISDDMLCSSDTSEVEDACQGDSGGPLFTRLPAGDGEHYLFTLVGVVSWGYGCAEKEYPGVYSRVAANTEWIDDRVCGDLSPNSCTADGKIRDYALDSLTANARRRTQNVPANNGRTLADLIKGEDYFGPATQKEELCELLGGNVDEETLPPASSSPSTSSSPTHAPIISPSMAPSVSPSLVPSSFPSGSPSLPPGKSPRKNFITKDRNGNQKAKGVMFQLRAEEADVMLERISFRTKDDKDTEVQVYLRLGSYDDFPNKGMDAADWGLPFFNGVPYTIRNGFREVTLEDVFTVPQGQIASIYLAGKKEIMFVEGQQEFAVADNAREDFQLSTGISTKKPFQQRLSDANFVGGLTYYTYTVATKVTSTPSLSPTRVTSTPSLSPSSSKLPSLPPNEDTSSPSMLPSNLPSLSPSENDNGGDSGEYTTPDVYEARENAKGVMFSITAKSKLTIKGLGILGKDAKESDLWVYYQNGSYKDFDALDKDEWIEVFNDKVMLDPDELVDIELDDDIMVRAGGTVSLYVLSKKGLLYTESSDEQFDIYAESNDFFLRVGTNTKKDFKQPEKLAEFVGRIRYQT
mmetsp:Transcript_1360/g.2271  ORF Transcript_1360/g.2271 Transcript_1360/m.2271 type:complete len:864 (+) Transcript_1360:168-2759(+)